MNDQSLSLAELVWLNLTRAQTHEQTSDTHRDQESDAAQDKARDSRLDYTSGAPSAPQHLAVTVDTQDEEDSEGAHRADESDDQGAHSTSGRPVIHELALPQSNLVLDRLLNNLATWRIDQSGGALDVDQTVRETARHGGLTTLVYTEDQRQDTQVILIEDTSPTMIPWRSCYTQLKKRLRLHPSFAEVGCFEIDFSLTPLTISSISLQNRRQEINRIKVPRVTEKLLVLVYTDGVSRAITNGNLAQAITNLAKPFELIFLNPLPTEQWMRGPLYQLTPARPLPVTHSDEELDSLPALMIQPEAHGLSQLALFRRDRASSVIARRLPQHAQAPKSRSKFKKRTSGRRAQDAVDYDARLNRLLTIMSQPARELIVLCGALPGVLTAQLILAIGDVFLKQILRLHLTPTQVRGAMVEVLTSGFFKIAPSQHYQGYELLDGDEIYVFSHEDAKAAVRRRVLPEAEGALRRSLLLFLKNHPQLTKSIYHHLFMTLSIVQHPTTHTVEDLSVLPLELLKDLRGRDLGETLEPQIEAVLDHKQRVMSDNAQSSLNAQEDVTDYEETTTHEQPEIEAAVQEPVEIDIHKLNESHLSALPTPLAEVLKAVIDEANHKPFRRAHRLIDCIEVFARLYAVAGLSQVADLIAQLESAEPSEDNLEPLDEMKVMLVNGLRAPSLGVWWMFARESAKIIEEIKHAHILPQAIRALTYKRSELKRAYDGENNLIRFRNKFAHGATPNDQECIKDFEEYGNRLLELIGNADELQDVEWIATDDHGQGYLARGLTIHKLGGLPRLEPRHCYVRRGDRLIDLYPLLCYRDDDSADANGFYFYNDLRAKHASLLNYPEAAYLQDRDIKDALLERFPIERWRREFRKTRLNKLASDAWNLWDHGHTSSPDIIPEQSAPILWFGDLERYERSALKIVTIGVNPSPLMFRQDDPWRSYRALADPKTRRDPETYQRALNAFQFDTWFEPFDSLLEPMGSGYLVNDKRNEALHLNLCPLMTNMIWSALSFETQEELGRRGAQLLRRLLEYLNPNFIFLSLSEKHLISLGSLGLSLLEGERTFVKSERSDTRYEVVELEWFGAEATLTKTQAVWLRKTNMRPVSPPRDLLTQLGRHYGQGQPSPIISPIVKLFFKQNNHVNSSQGFTAYYHTQAPHDHVDWDASRDNIAGQTLYLYSNHFGVADTKIGPHGHFGAPRRGDQIIIFQRVCRIPRVVTHILEFTDDSVSTFEESFPNNARAISAFKDWPYLRKTKVISALDPALCGAVVVEGEPDLRFTGELPRGAVTFDDLGGGYVSNGRVSLHSGQFLNDEGSPKITIAKVRELILENPVYLHEQG